MKLTLRHLARTFDVDGPITIGRSRGCELRLLWPTVSGSHAKLFLLGGYWMVLDLASKNGTFVNGKRIDDLTGPVVLKDGDVINISGTELFVSLYQEVQNAG